MYIILYIHNSYIFMYFYNGTIMELCGTTMELCGTIDFCQLNKLKEV